VLVIARRRELFSWAATVLIVAGAAAAYPFLRFNLAQQLSDVN
jgi:hypothetical protein